MRIYSHTKFSGHWPVGTAAVVIAEDRDMAVTLLEQKLKDIGLSQKIERDDFMVIGSSAPVAVILRDGDY